MLDVNVKLHMISSLLPSEVILGKFHNLMFFSSQCGGIKVL
jgi:hypothetical protein